MTGPHRARGEAGADQYEASTWLGVTRTDVPCGPDVHRAVAAAVERWAEDRALSGTARLRLRAAAVAACRQGWHHEASEVRLSLRWLDPDRVRVELEWRGVPAPTPPRPAAAPTSTAVLDRCCETHGLDLAGPTDWVVVDTADTDGAPAP